MIFQACKIISSFSKFSMIFHGTGNRDGVDYKILGDNWRNFQRYFSPWHFLSRLIVVFTPRSVAPEIFPLYDSQSNIKKRWKTSVHFFGIWTSQEA